MSTVTHEPGLLTSREVADRLGVCVATIQRAARDGSLPAVRLRPRGNLRFRRDLIDELSAGHSLVGAVEPTAADDRALVDPAARSSADLDALAAGATSGEGVEKETAA